MSIDLYNLYLKYSGIPKKYLTDTPLTPCIGDEEVFKFLHRVETHIDSFVDKGNNLLIYSNNTGNGKTSWACKIAKSFISKHHDNAFQNYTPVLYLPVVDFLIQEDEEKYHKSEDLIEKEKIIKSANIVIFDDIANQMVKESDLKVLYKYINYRYSNGLTSIFTSNADKEQLFKLLTAPIADRIVNSSYVCRITDSTNRKSTGEY